MPRRRPTQKVRAEGPGVNPWPGKITVTLQDVLLATGLGKRTLDRMLADGLVPGAFRTCGATGKWLFRVSDLLAWIERGMEV